MFNITHHFYNKILLSSKLQVTFFAFIIITLGLMINHAKANAEVFVYNLENVFSGSTPDGAAPWATATFTDVGVNEVRLNLSTSNFGGQNDFISNWYLNFDPAQNPANLLVTQTTPPAIPGNPPQNTGITLGTNAISADGGGKYDMNISFNTSQSSGQRFVGGLVASFDILGGLDTIDASSFNFLSGLPAGNGQFFVAAHVQNIGYQSDSAFIGSNEVSVPEPATYFVLGSLLLLGCVLKKHQGSLLSARP